MESGLAETPLADSCCSQMRVLVVAPTFGKAGGVSQYFRILMPHFRIKAQHFPIGARQDGAVFVLTLFRLFVDWVKFGVALQSSSPDLVHLNPSFGLKALIRDGVSLLIAKCFRKPVLVFFHGWDQSCERLVIGRLSWLFRFLYGRADAFVVLAGEFGKTLRSVGITAPVFRLLAPVEDEIFEFVQSASQAKQEPENHEFHILYLARVERAKGIFEAIDAFAMVQTQFPLASLTVAGDGVDLPFAKEYVREKSILNVSFQGHVTGHQKQKAFRDASVYLLASHSEGLPISVLEAMAHGCPVVAAAVGGLRDMFLDGTMGFLSPVAEPETLANLLCRLLQDRELCRSAGAFNADYAWRNCQPVSVARSLEQIYQHLLSTELV